MGKCIATPIDDFKAFPTPLCSHLYKYHKYGNYDKALYVVSPTTSPKANLKEVLTFHQAELTPPLLPHTPTKTFVQISRIDIEGPRTKLFIFFFSCVLRENKREGRKQKGLEEKGRKQKAEWGNKEGMHFNFLLRCVYFPCIEMHQK